MATSEGESLKLSDFEKSKISDLKNENVPQVLYWSIDEVCDYFENELKLPEYKVTSLHISATFHLNRCNFKSALKFNFQGNFEVKRNRWTSAHLFGRVASSKNRRQWLQAHHGKSPPLNHAGSISRWPLSYDYNLKAHHQECSANDVAQRPLLEQKHFAHSSRPVRIVFGGQERQRRQFGQEELWRIRAKHPGQHQMAASSHQPGLHHAQLLKKIDSFEILWILLRNNNNKSLLKVEWLFV